MQISRPVADVTVTLGGGSPAQSVANLANQETLNLSGTSLDVGTPGAPGGALVGEGHVTVNLGATLTVNSLAQSSLAIDAGGHVVIRAHAGDQPQGAYLRALSVSSSFGGPPLDLGNTDLVLNYAAVSPFLALESALMSSAITADHALAVLEAAQTSFLEWPVGSGHPIDSTTLIVSFTFKGDVTVDRKVDDADLAVVTANLGLATPNPAMAWIQGDVNGDGIVDAADQQIVVEHIGLGVPEPTALPLLVLGGCLMRRRARPRLGRC